ncbi:hypothetical protein OIU79_023963 [Salix purpurea]|uniref:Uncharacterized protein n=1 Tax=Salix purpurea TaxID=77065 RepID=A0A9Q1A9M4_SALPP|nr:hypothetical protein OIU79_023963 [Salix purpurea]
MGPLHGGRDYAENEESRSVHNECAPVEKNKSTHIERVTEEKNQQRVGIPQDGHSMTNGKSNLMGNHTLKVIIKGKNETRPVGQVEETITEPRYPNEKGAYPSKDRNLTAQEEPSMTEEQDRVLKGKMKEVESNVCTVNDSSSLQSHDTLDEEESSATTTTNGGNANGRDTSPTTFTKVRKKGGKKNGGARRL